MAEINGYKNEVEKGRIVANIGCDTGKLYADELDGTDLYWTDAAKLLGIQQEDDHFLYFFWVLDNPAYPDSYVNTPYSAVAPLIAKRKAELGGKFDPNWNWGYTAMSFTPEEIAKLRALDDERKRPAREAREKEQRAVQAMAKYAASSGKTVVKVRECWECGTWIILGGAAGRLPKDVWRTAVEELATAQRAKWQQQSQGGKVPLSRVVIGERADGQEGKFDLETPHFLFAIVASDDSHCAMVEE